MEERPAGSVKPEIHEVFVHSRPLMRTENLDVSKPRFSPTIRIASDPAALINEEPSFNVPGVTRDWSGPA
jgi:hypothetical protein